MKKLLTFLSTITLVWLLTSCEKKEENPFIGSWENRTTTDISLVVITWTFRSDMTVTFHGVVTVNGQTNESSTEYTYSYTETEITMKEEGEPAETTSYIINSEFLIFSPGTEFAWTFTRVK
ncbi:MAG: hypothetical protein RBT02_05360 [Bacteroidales bacterium]|jgi:hypothetical protein|nr:hypothetical protein [Bacteroidales bacterium]